MTIDFFLPCFHSIICGAKTGKRMLRQRRRKEEESDNGGSEAAKQVAKEKGEGEERGLWLEVIKGVVLVVVFFALYIPLQRFVLDPMRGLTHEQDERAREQVMDVICPPGQNSTMLATMHGVFRFSLLATQITLVVDTSHHWCSVLF